MGKRREGKRRKKRQKSLTSFLRVIQKGRQLGKLTQIATGQQGKEEEEEGGEECAIRGGDRGIRKWEEENVLIEKKGEEDKCCSQMEKQKRMIGDRRSPLTPGNQHGGNIAGCAGVIRWWRRMRRNGMNAGSERRRRGEMEEERERERERGLRGRKAVSAPGDGEEKIPKHTTKQAVFRVST